MSITKKTAEYIVKNESKTDAMIAHLEQYGLLSDVRKRLSNVVAHTASIFSEQSETVLLIPEEISNTDLQKILKEYAIIEHPKVILDKAILDGYVLYHAGKKVTVTAQDRIQQFVNK
jgi:hypothetical protein